VLWSFHWVVIGNLDRFGPVALSCGSSFLIGCWLSSFWNKEMDIEREQENVYTMLKLHLQSAGLFTILFESTDTPDRGGGDATTSSFSQTSEMYLLL
jgi:hypothetical protein